MKLSILKQFLENALSYSKFKTTIQENVEYYKKQLHKKGASAPVEIVEDTTLVINKSHLQTLCQAYLNGEVTNYEMYYIVDALLLSSYGSEDSIVSFKNEQLHDIFEELTDPEINGGELTSEKVKDIMKRGNLTKE